MDPNDKTADVLGLGGLTEASMGSEAQPQQFNEGSDFEPEMNGENVGGSAMDVSRGDADDATLASKQLKVQPDLWRTLSEIAPPEAIMAAIQKIQERQQEDHQQKLIVTIGQIMMHQQMKQEIGQEMGKHLARAAFDGKLKMQPQAQNDHAYQKGEWYDLSAEGDNWYIIPHYGPKARQKVPVKPNSSKAEVDAQAVDATWPDDNSSVLVNDGQADMSRTK